MVDRSTEEQLDINDIQGDILVGLQKQVQAFIGFAILDAARFKKFLQGLSLTSARDALLAERRIDAFKKANGKGLLDIRGTNIAFSFAGLQKLEIPDLDFIADTSFKAGLAARSAALGDPTDGLGASADWRLGNGVGELDGLLIITGRGGLEVAAQLQDIDLAIGQDVWLPFYVENGQLRPGAESGHEHFGFLDGVSQPSIRGRIDAVIPDTEFLNPTRSRDPNQGLPGSDLHWPGEFVFGYQAQSGTDVEQPIAPKDGGLPWMRNGSYMVFRRLEQMVPEFHNTIAARARDQGVAAATLEARIVGRYPHGAPLIGNDAGDDLALGACPLKNNDFDFAPTDVPPRSCPYAAHIRKAYPRNDITPAAQGAPPGSDPNVVSEADTQTHRVIRRGIPFGREVTSVEQAAGKTQLSRGLMFVCYQTTIAGQFEFILQNWVNNPDFAVAGAGHDIVLGQTADRKRAFTDDGTQIDFPEDFVRPTGGGYFFMPSISAVHSLLSAQIQVSQAVSTTMPHVEPVANPGPITVPAAAP